MRPACCPGMCPEREWSERQKQGRLHRLELATGAAVKEWRRPAAGCEAAAPEELRPPAVLLQTMRHLVERVVPRAEPGHGPEAEPWPLVHDFVVDRLRSVRQDLAAQRLGGRPAAAILEQSLRFLLAGPFWLGRPPPCDPRPREPGSIDAQVRECFSRLLAIYSEGEHENRAEFQALALLYDLGSDAAYHRALQLPAHIKDSPEMKMAFTINQALAEGNYVRCLRVVRRLPFLESCAVYRHIPMLRHRLLRAFSHGYSCSNCRYPLQTLAELLAVDSQDIATDLCQRHGQQVTGNSVCFQKSSYKDPDTNPGLEELELVIKKQGDKTRSNIIRGHKMTATEL
ncbi:SAC3 domain-containing protein 1 [Pristis pectinata]|uniref:SAC3 domain-containing protein 1 n=1 Tax=Pristis pectinata TaxID=685728 RepID=UPI00223E0853|nr:SAC3 domain-containing protein 1 [Pristis pectinata]